MIKFYYRALDAMSGGEVYQGYWMWKRGIPPVPAWTVNWFFDLQRRWRRS